MAKRDLKKTGIPMRPGVMLVTSKRVNRVNLNYIVRKLSACCDLEGGVCDDCPDKKICVEAYDQRCGYNPGKKKEVSEK